jgi:hypothetical protein
VSALRSRKYFFNVEIFIYILDLKATAVTAAIGSGGERPPWLPLGGGDCQALGSHRHQQ